MEDHMTVRDTIAYTLGYCFGLLICKVIIFDLIIAKSDLTILAIVAFIGFVGGLFWLRGRLDHGE
jgi:glucose uptake protein GlcU